MSAKLRERLLVDVANPDLKERCYDVIRQLKLESDLLKEENKKIVGEAVANKKFMDAEEKKKNNPTLVYADNDDDPKRNSGIGDADSEAMGKL